MKRLLPVFLALILFGLLVYIGLNQDKHDHYTITTQKGQKIPNVTLTTPDGKKVSIEEFKGKVLLINFWATWCPPCKEEIPMFKEIYEKYRDRGFEILAINMDPENLTGFLKNNPLPFPVFVINEKWKEPLTFQGFQRRTWLTEEEL
ncbi:TlpA disulfide reductase family protein [Aquifex aeolicus]|uniref:Thiol disulfide interchange protein n=1 Tax=Aquifex aeolicus (strain VF5) TaxID=224324 RepID=O66542_AQUAE|nr:TlpA disulfide reductase family protein [Aquifex aeolicus]AAC06493.1 thiol disulfide interchange protein [Aquifex aeolicus VF5]